MNTEQSPEFNYTLYVTMFQALSIFGEEKLQFGNALHIAARDRLLEVQPQDPDYWELQDLEKHLRSKYGK